MIDEREATVGPLDVSKAAGSDNEPVSFDLGQISDDDILDPDPEGTPMPEEKVVTNDETVDQRKVDLKRQATSV